MRAPFLSIILPVLNEAAGIRAHLETLQGIRDEGVQLILVDGGSDDDTVQRAETLVDLTIHSPRGRAAQMNAGARVSGSDVLLFLHADTTLPCSAHAVIHEAIAAGALWGRFDVCIDSSSPLLRIVERMMNWRSHLTGIATGDQAIFVRRDVFEALGGFPDIPLMEDIALTTRLRRAGSPARLRQRVVTSGRRWEKHGVLRTIFLMWRLRAEFFFGADPHKLAVRYGYKPRPQ